MAEQFYNTAFKKFVDGDIDLLVDTIVALLLDSSYSPDIDSDEFISDVSGDEIVGGGYARQTLTTKTTTVDNAEDRVEFSSDDITGWNADTFTDARFLVLAADLGADGASPLLVYFDLATDRDAPLEFLAPANGWFAIGACT